MASLSLLGVLAAVSACDEAPGDDISTPGLITRLVMIDGEPVWLETTETQHRLRRREGDSVVELAAIDAVADASSGWLATNGDAIVWAWPGERVLRVVEGNAARVLVTADEIFGLAIQGGYVWWTEHNAGLVRRVPFGGGEPETVTSHEFPTGIVAGPDGVYVLMRLDAVILRVTEPGVEPALVTEWLGDNTMELAGGPRDLLWVSWSSGTLLTAPMSGGEARALMPLRRSPEVVAVGDEVALAVSDIAGLEGEALYSIGLAEGATPHQHASADAGCFTAVGLAADRIWLADRCAAKLRALDR